MIRPLGSLTGLAGLAALLGWLAMAAGSAGAADAAAEPADGAWLDGVELGDGPEVDEASFKDLVADAQRMLTLRGYDTGPIDGQFGLRTQRAIRAYQNLAREHGYLEALKGPPRAEPGDPAGRRELVRMEPIAPSRTQ